MRNVEKQKLDVAKKSIYTNDVNIDDILVSNKHQIRKKNFKYFVVDVNYSNDAIGPLLVKLPKQNVSIKGFEKVCHIGLIKNIKLYYIKCSGMWDKIKNFLKKIFMLK